MVYNIESVFFEKKAIKYFTMYYKEFYDGIRGGNQAWQKKI